MYSYYLRKEREKKRVSCFVHRDHEEKVDSLFCFTGADITDFDSLTCANSTEDDSLTGANSTKVDSVLCYSSVDVANHTTPLSIVPQLPDSLVLCIQREIGPVS